MITYQIHTFSIPLISGISKKILIKFLNILFTKTMSKNKNIKLAEGTSIEQNAHSLPRVLIINKFTIIELSQTFYPIIKINET
jgi:hypothetical protein